MLKFYNQCPRINLSLFSQSRRISDKAYERDAITCRQTTDWKFKMKMFGWQIHSYGGVEELQYSNKLKVPQILNANECLVHVRATTVNPIDLAMLRGYGSKVLNVLRLNYNDIEFPLTLGREFCGIMVNRGMAVSQKLLLGDRVWGVVPVHAEGSHAEYVKVPDYCISHAPAVLSDEEAAAVLYAGLTAWSGLYITGGLGNICIGMHNLRGGEVPRVLVLGGSGSVGSIAIQILKSQNIQVVATANEDAIALVEGLGADVVIDYKNPIQMNNIRTCGPFDIVLDCAGIGAEYAERINAIFDQYITFSSPLLHNIDQSGLGLGMLKNISNVLTLNVKSIKDGKGFVKWGFFIPSASGIEFLNRLVDRKKLLPIIDSVYKFPQLPEAFKRWKRGHMRGKVVVTVS